MSLRFFIQWLSAACLIIVMSSVHAQSDIQMTEVVFEELEPGIEPYSSRFLVNEYFLRLDDGTDSGDFVLFDRKTGQIHSFNHHDETHLIIKSQQQPALEFEVDFKVEKNKLQDSPKIDGIMPVEHQFFADGNKCKQSVNVSGFLADMASAMMDYEQALVEQSKSTLSRVPASMRTACYMANNFLYASEYLKVGFPLLVVDDEGKQKRLLSFQKVSKPEHILRFPEAYRVYYPN